MIVKGQIEKVNSRKTAWGDQYSMLVNGVWYTIGKTAQGASDGDWVEFSATTNARGFHEVDRGSLKPLDKQPAQNKTAPTPPPAAGNYVNDSRQGSIVFQSSRKDALEFVRLANDCGCVDFGKAKGADKLAILELYVDKFTEHFVAEATALKTNPSQGTGEKAAVTPVASNDGPEDDLPF